MPDTATDRRTAFALSFAADAGTMVASHAEFAHRLLSAAMAEAAAGRHMRPDGSGFDVPLTLSIDVPEPPPPGARSEVCGMTCIDLFGHHVACISVCHVEQ